MFHTLFYQPTLNALLWIHQAIPGADFGVAIVLLTVAVRTLLIPVAKQGIQSQAALQRIQPELKTFRKKYKSDPQQLTKETLALYKREGIHPFSGFVPILIQLPVIFALIRVINTVFPRNGTFDPAAIAGDLYGFVAAPEILEVTGLFGAIPDLTAQSVVLAVLAGAAQFIQGRLMFHTRPQAASQETDMQRAMRTQMLYIFPVLTVFIAASLPAAFALYWFTATAFAAVQQVLTFRDRNANPTKP